MADEATKTSEAPEAPAKARRRRTSATAEPAAKSDAPATPPKKKSDVKPAPRRPSLDPEASRLLHVREDRSDRRPRFVRQATHRYWRIGRRGAWRRPRGLQSKQRRHYGYRPQIVRVGYGGPRRTRGLTPTGFVPVVVRTEAELGALDPARQAAIIARTVGTRRRLVLEEAGRKRGIHILNPIVREQEET